MIIDYTIQRNCAIWLPYDSASNVYWLDEDYNDIPTPAQLAEKWGFIITVTAKTDWEYDHIGFMNHKEAALFVLCLREYYDQ